MNNNSDYLVRFKQNSNVLEVGGGNNPLTNTNGDRVTYNMDIMPGPTVDVVHDASDFPWPMNDASFDGVYSVYCWEHIEWRKSLDFLKEIYRVLKPDSKAIIITANTLEQCKKVVEEGINAGTTELLFGSQEFPDFGGVHKASFSPSYAKELFEKAGFKQVNVLPHPVSKTDMIIEAYKNPIEKNEKKEIFERSYFEDGSYGYKDYRDFCTHYSTAKIILNSTPKVENVLSVGCGRGYVARILENNGVKATGMDVSNHCSHTRVIEDFILWDARITPWKSVTPSVSSMVGDMIDKQFDLLLSMNFLEHIEEDKLDDVLREMARVSNRGMHGIHMTDAPFEEMDKDIDSTHRIKQPKIWWETRFKTVVPDYNVVIEHPRLLEYEDPGHQPPISNAPGVSLRDGKLHPDDGLVKVNLGSFKDCFYFCWKNIDIIPLHEFARAQSYDYLQHDVTKGLPMYKDGEVDLLFSSHLLEHLDREQGKKLLQECFRVMKPGAVIRLSIPDTKTITEKYLDGNISEYRYVNTGVEDCMDDCDAYYNLLLAGHKTIYDEDALRQLLETVGFKNIETMSPFKSRNQTIQTQTSNCHQSLSCILEAEK